MRRRRRRRQLEYFVTTDEEGYEIWHDAGSNLKAAPSSNLIASDAEIDFAAYDKLPKYIQRALQEMTVRFSSVGVLAAKRHNDGQTILMLIRQTEHNDIVRFARAYKQKAGVDYPHTAANATILRYGKR